jgi:two-component system response regulator FixJ
MMTRHVHIVDDDVEIGGVLAMIAEAAGLNAVAHVSAEAFLASFDPRTIGCVVTDAHMPKMTGLDLQQALKERGLSVPVIVITGQGVVSLAVEALKAGAIDFIEKPFGDEVFLAAVRRALAAADRDAKQREDQEAVAERAAQLSGREREVMDLVTGGLSSPAIGQKLGISVRTVESHRARVMDKMDARNLAELIRLSIRLAGGDRAPAV